MKSKKRIIILFIGALVLFAAGAFTYTVVNEFDAQGYVEAVLKQHFEGKVSQVSSFVQDKSEDELQKQYEEGVVTFVENNITNGIEMEEELKQQYVDLCKKIFKEMKYTVKEAEKISMKEYHVSVEYQKSDVYQRFAGLVPKEKTRIEEKVQKGEYKGTEEEITQQMQDEYVQNCCILFEQAYQEMEFAEEETEIFVVKKNSNGLFELDEVQITNFIKKIMGTQVNQD